MTAKTRTSLAALFEDGDSTSGTNFSDMFDSFLNLVDTAAQSIAGPVTMTTVGVTTVSATNIEATTVSASAVHASAGVFVNIDADKVSAQSVIASAVNANTVSAQAIITSAFNANTVSAQRVIVSAVRVLAALSAATINVATLQINADASSAPSGGAASALSTNGSAARFVTVTVSGATYWLPLLLKA